MHRTALLHALGLLAFTAALWLGGPASAQGVTPPFDDSVCTSPSEVTASLHDPNGFYAAAPKCEKLCKRALKDCKQYVKAAAVCRKSEIGDDAAYAKTECEVEFEHGQETQTCKTEIEHAHGTEQSAVRAERTTALGACDDWASTCKATCGTASAHD